jgi:carboxyl-terminal processing protease
MKTRTLKIPALVIVMVLQAVWACYLPAQQSFAFNADRRTSPPGVDSVTPVIVFEQVWNLLNDNYPYFGQRGIDWKSVHAVYGGLVNPATTEEELFNVLSEMLEIFQDGHVNLEFGKKRFCSGVNDEMVDFKWKLVRDKYLGGRFQSSPDSMFYYGWLTDDIAYMRIRRFPPKEVVETYIDSIIDGFRNAKGIILDIRGNSGGNGFGVAALGSRFADQRRLYMKNANRTGQNREYTSVTYHCIEPLGPFQYTGPVILLQNRHSESGSELFALALRTLPHATSVGEITGGSFAAYYPEKLVNGWTLTMPWSYATDQDGFCWEGIGVPPNLRKENSKEDIEAGNDKVLELAVGLVKAGGSHGKDARGILVQAPLSLVDRFLETSRIKGTGAAVSEFEKLQGKTPEKYYFSIQEFGLAVRKLNEEDKEEEAMALLELGRKAFPYDINTLYFLARFYDSKGKTEKSQELYQKIVTLNPSFPWDRNKWAEAVKRLAQ